MHSVSTTNTWTVLYTLFKYRFCGKCVVKGGQLFGNHQRAVHFHHQNRGVDRRPSIAKKKLLRQKYKKAFVGLLPKDQIDAKKNRLVFADRIEQVKKTKLELELIKIVHSFLDGHGNYTSDLVSFKKKFL